MDRSISINDPRVISLTAGKKKTGPPNRMNDMTYTDWMKFQKSFFRFKSHPSLIDECVHFFTKGIWKEGQRSKSLIIGYPDFKLSSIKEPRLVHSAPNVDTISKLEKFLTEATKSETKYDYIMINFDHYIKTLRDWDDFAIQKADSIFLKLRQSLNPGRYCALTINDNQKTFEGFPVPWALASISRRFMRLRDEKIGIKNDLADCEYALFFQADFDNRKHETHLSSQLSRDPISDQISTWVMPKPPRRTKEEVKHPAKYPETLVEGFLSDFSKPGDWIIDPMVGTGSTAIAGLSTGRNVVGVELSAEFADYAITRTKALGSSNECQIYKRDIRKLQDVNELKAKKFDCMITSPPYWSMLNNKGSENQRKRRDENLKTNYSDDNLDLGNIENYDDFVSELVHIYEDLSKHLKKGAYATIVVKNIKRNHTIFPLAWDLVWSLCGKNGSYSYGGTTFWCQDDVGMKPFAVGTHWVSNIVHHYCLHLKKC